MTDHIVVFDGTDRLVGETVTIDVDDATSFTLYGKVQTANQVGGDGTETAATRRVPARQRIGLDVV